MPPFYHESMPNTSGIYRITCIPTGKIYVGSAVNLSIRWKNHINTLRRNVHDNSKLQRAWNKYGEQAFTFEIVELVLPISLTAREQYWFNKFKPFGNNGFNIHRVAGSPLGHTVSPETREKLSRANRGTKLSPETRERMRGRKDTPETREKKRRASQGRVPSVEARAKRSASLIAATRDKRKALIVISPDGIEYTIVGIHEFCREHHLDRSTLLRVAKGKISHHKGWKARFPD